MLATRRAGAVIVGKNQGDLPLIWAAICPPAAAMDSRSVQPCAPAIPGLNSLGEKQNDASPQPRTFLSGEAEEALRGDRSYLPAHRFFDERKSGALRVVRQSQCHRPKYQHGDAEWRRR